MKKFILLVVLGLFTAISIQAISFKCVSLSVRAPGNEWSSWTPVDIEGFWDEDNNRIVINSQDRQIIDFKNPQILYFDKYIEIYSYDATDTNYASVGIEIYIYYKGAGYVKILYNNLEYKYKIYKVE